MDNHNRKKKTVDDTVCEIHKFSGYAVLSNCFVRSTNLSWSAIGLLARVMDFPHEWNFSKAGLIAICPDGETAIDTALSELKEWGYLEIKTLMPNESSTGRIQPLYSFYEYSARDTSIPQYDYELETFMVENAVLNRVKKTDNYTMISSKLLRNKEIPNKLLGFLLKVLSLPDYWHFSMSGLKAICKEGKTAVHNAVNKLIDMGYLVRTQLASRIIEVFMYLSIAPIPMATMMDSGEWASIGKNWIKQLLALSFQGFFIVVALGIFKTLFSNAIVALNASTDGVILQMGLLLGYTAALIFTILRTGAISKSVFNAH